MVYCTLFGSNYLDKGMTMIDSLLDVSPDSIVYVLCMDDLTLQALNRFYLFSVHTISLEEFEDGELKLIKNNRTFAEYCWTSTAKLIRYVIKKGIDRCTYIDADLFFYRNPDYLIEEMINQKCTVQVVPHRFPNNKRGRIQEKESGKNCVQFNTFTNSDDSIELLEQWIRQCVEECSLENGGDQKYTDSWGQLTFVNVSKNGGAGIAPWNITRFRRVKNKILTVFDIEEKKEYDLVFYHFQNVTSLDKYRIIIQPLLAYGRLDKELVKSLYHNYLRKLFANKNLVEKEFGYLPIVTKYVSDLNDKDSFFKRVKRALKMKPSEILRKILYKKRFITRKKIAIFDIRNANK